MSNIARTLQKYATVKVDLKNKRAQRALGRSPERTTNVVHQILVEDL